MEGHAYNPLKYNQHPPPPKREGNKPSQMSSTNLLFSLPFQIQWVVVVAVVFVCKSIVLRLKIERKCSPPPLSLIEGHGGGDAGNGVGWISFLGVARG